MKRYRPLKGIDWVVVLLWTAIICILLYFLTACSTSKEVQKIDVMWHDGKCLLIIEGVSATEAQQITQMWQFKECEIKVSGSDKSNGIKPPMKLKE